MLQGRGVHQRCVHTGLHLVFVFVFHLYLLPFGQQHEEENLDDENRNDDNLWGICRLAPGQCDYYDDLGTM